MGCSVSLCLHNKSILNILYAINIVCSYVQYSCDSKHTQFFKPYFVSWQILLYWDNIHVRHHNNAVTSTLSSEVIQFMSHNTVVTSYLQISQHLFFEGSDCLHVRYYDNLVTSTFFGDAHLLMSDNIVMTS